MSDSTGPESGDKSGNNLRRGEIQRACDRHARDGLLLHLATCDKCWEKARCLPIRRMVTLAVDSTRGVRLRFVCGDEGRWENLSV